MVHSASMFCSHVLLIDFYMNKLCVFGIYVWPIIHLVNLVVVVNYEARLEDGTLVAKSDGLEFTVEDGQCLLILLRSSCYKLWD